MVAGCKFRNGHGDEDCGTHANRTHRLSSPKSLQRGLFSNASNKKNDFEGAFRTATSEICPVITTNEGKKPRGIIISDYAGQDT